MSALPVFAEIARALPAAANAPLAESGEILLACPVARGGMVLFGWHAARLPRQGTVLADAAGVSGDGPYRLHAWRRDGHGTAWFVAAVQLREPAALAPGARISLRTARSPDIVLGTLPAAACAPEPLADRLAAEGQGQAGPLALLLADLCIAAPRSPALGALLRGFLARAAEEDGVIEIVGPGNDAILLQGWGRAESDDPPTALLVGQGVSRHTLRVATFDRTDIRPPATGSVLLLETTGRIDAAGLAELHLAGNGFLRRRRILPERPLLDSAALGSHLRDLLPRLSCDPETRSAVAALSRPRYAGHETVSSLDRPVRAALDVAAVLPGAGAYLCGWLIDARRDVRNVTLCSASGQRARIDAGWSRLQRPDVAEAFRTDPRFADDDSRQLHGFAAFAPDIQGDGLHLDIDLGHTSAFLPVAPLRDAPRALLRRAMQSVDLHRPGALAAIAAQLGPWLGAAITAGLPPPASVIRRRAEGAARTALLLPLPPAPSPPQTALSFLLAEPLAPGEALVLVAPPCWDETALTALDRALDLYGLQATVVSALEDLERPEALDLAARATDATTLICLGAGVIGVTPGWRQALQAQLRRMPAASVTFPTALYEDNAIRSIGIAGIERLGSAPWARLRRPCAGHPADAIAGPRSGLAAGSLAGAAVSRPAWQATGGFGGGAMLAPAQEFTFFARLTAAGGHFAHQTNVQVIAPESPAQPAARWREVASLADGWLLAQGHAGDGAA